MEEVGKNLQKRVYELEEEIYRLKLEKAIVVPTESMYRTKAEYDSLRAHCNKLFKEARKLDERYRKIEKINSDLQYYIQELMIILDDLEIDYEKNGLNDVWKKIEDPGIIEMYETFVETADSKKKEKFKQRTLDNMVPFARFTMARRLEVEEDDIRNLNFDELIKSPIFVLFLKEELKFNIFAMNF